MNEALADFLNNKNHFLFFTLPVESNPPIEEEIKIAGKRVVMM